MKKLWVVIVGNVLNTTVHLKLVRMVNFVTVFYN